jgi:DUF1365 family protein
LYGFGHLPDFMNSCIYQGRVLHRRRHPVTHDFTYRLFMLCLDLAELPEVFRGRWLWSCDRPNLAWFRRVEHLGEREVPLDQAVRHLVRQRTGEVCDGPVRLLTHLRYFGFQMNPVSFYFCYDRHGQLQHIVAEVNNTPWGEQHCYVMGRQHFLPGCGGPRERLAKEFHVSPFLPMEMNYQWRVTPPDERLNIGIAVFRGQLRMLNVAMSLDRLPLTAANLRRILLRYPWMTGKVFAAIYWQALRLRLKGVPFFPHPDRRPAEAMDSAPPSSCDSSEKRQRLISEGPRKNHV